jgi:hypothetical protein
MEKREGREGKGRAGEKQIEGETESERELGRWRKREKLCMSAYCLATFSNDFIHPSGKGAHSVLDSTE